MNDNNTSIALSKYNPLNRILFFDNFDDGLHGWTELIGNYEGSLDNVLSPYRDHRPPQLSTLSMWDTGSAGSMDGMYALKIATRAKRAIKPSASSALHTASSGKSVWRRISASSPKR